MITQLRCKEFAWDLRNTWTLFMDTLRVQWPMSRTSVLKQKIFYLSHMHSVKSHLKKIANYNCNGSENKIKSCKAFVVVIRSWWLFASKATTKEAFLYLSFMSVQYKASIDREFSSGFGMILAKVLLLLIPFEEILSSWKFISNAKSLTTIL